MAVSLITIFHPCKWLDAPSLPHLTCRDNMVISQLSIATIVSNQRQRTALIDPGLASGDHVLTGANTHTEDEGAYVIAQDVDRPVRHCRLST